MDMARLSMTIIVWSASLLLSSLMCACSALGADDTGAIGDITYTEDIQPVLQVRCAPCHTGEGMGGTDFALLYGENFLASGRCPGKRVYQCIPELAKEGAMPPNVGCTGDPTADAGNSLCLTTSELNLIKVWIAGGAPE